MKVAFSKKGMSNEQLIEIATKYSELDVKEQDWYGHGKILREYGYCPKKLILKVFLPHGISQWDYLPSYINKYANGFEFFYSKRTAKLFEESTNLKPTIIEAPFILYKKLNDIKVKDDAEGTIVFPSHSTHDIDVDFDIKHFCDNLNKLPEHFKPIHICLYYLDVIKGHHNTYLDFGFPVHCVGNKNNSDFIHNWYEIATNFKYSLGNEIGSHMFYLTDLGIPYSIFGARPIYYNISCRETAAIGKFDYQHKQIHYCRQVFSGLYLEPSAEQRKLTNDELGIGVGAGRLKAASKIYTAWFKLFLLNNLMIWIYKSFPYLRRLKESLHE